MRWSVSTLYFGFPPPITRLAQPPRAGGRHSEPAISRPCQSCSQPPDRSPAVAMPAAASRTIRARCRLRCSVFVERLKPSSSDRSSTLSVIFVAFGMIFFIHP